MSSMPLSTANWHWKNKNVTPWAKTWFERELVGVSVKGEGEEAVKIEQITGVDGDVELGQRKSKLITIFDVKIDLKWAGTTSGGEEVGGTLTIPEVSHENIVDGTSEVQYEWRLSGDSPDGSQSVYALAKSKLPSLLEAKLADFSKAIIDTHSKDVQVSAPSTPPPAPSTSASASKPAASTASGPAVKKAEPKKGLSTTKVELEGRFMAAADDLFSLLTDEGRIPMWSRAPAKSSAQPGTAYELFGGGVKGTYVRLTPGKEVVQTWRLQSPTWPEGHEATLTTTFDQSSDSTAIKFVLEGVPVGMEDEIRRNLDGYYIHGLKSIGLGTVL